MQKIEMDDLVGKILNLYGLDPYVGKLAFTILEKEQAVKP